MGINRWSRGPQEEREGSQGWRRGSQREKGGYVLPPGILRGASWEPREAQGPGEEERRRDSWLAGASLTHRIDHER
jgi:hypothetical protein